MHIVGITGQAGVGKDEVAGRFVRKHDYMQLSLADPLKRFGLHVFGFDVIQLWGPSSARNTFDPMFLECEIRSKNITFEPGCNMLSIRKACDPGWGDAAVRLTQYAPGWVEDLVGFSAREEAVRQLYYWFASLGHHYSRLSPRIMLQHLGTEWGRQAVKENIWIDTLINTAELVLQGYRYDRETGISQEKTFPPVGIVVSDVRFFNELDCLKEVDGKLVRVTRESAARKSRKLGISDHASEAEQKTFTDDMFDAVLNNEGTLPGLYQNVDVVASCFKGMK